MRVRWERLAVHLLAWATGLIWIIPFMGILMASIRPHGELVHGWWQLSEVNLSFENYLNAWSHSTAPIGEGLKNSLTVTIPATLLPLLIGAFAAYGFLRLRFPGRNILFLGIVLLLSIPQQMVAVPLFQTLLGIGLLNTFAGLILTHTAWGLPWVTMFMRNFMTTLPVEVEEAASLDGANRFQIFYKIILPLTLPALASVAALQFTWVWNDFFLAQINPKHFPFPSIHDLPPISCCVSILRFSLKFKTTQ